MQHFRDKVFVRAQLHENFLFEIYAPKPPAVNFVSVSMMRNCTRWAAPHRTPIVFNKTYPPARFDLWRWAPRRFTIHAQCLYTLFCLRAAPNWRRTPHQKCSKRIQSSRGGGSNLFAPKRPPGNAWLNYMLFGKYYFVFAMEDREFNVLVAHKYAGHGRRETTIYLHCKIMIKYTLIHKSINCNFKSLSKSKRADHHYRFWS